MEDHLGDSGLRLIELASGAKPQVRLAARSSDVEVTGLTADSRDVRPGFLFAALPGGTEDGRNYIKNAFENGAVVIHAPDGTNPPSGVPLATSPDPRAALAHMAAAFHLRQPATIAAVTGTNGKTSVANFTRQIWNRLGFEAASIGTLGLQTRNSTANPNLTTPEPVALHATLADLAKKGISHLVLEASSHGLDQRRMDAVALRAAAFTNLTRDHLDYHGTTAKYFAAKARLFNDLLPAQGTAILNADVQQAKAITESFSGNTFTYGRKGRDLVLRNASPTCQGTRLALTVMGRDYDVCLPLAGAFQFYNVMCAAGLAIGCGAEVDDTIDCLDKLESVPGRLQFAGFVSGGSVYIDYAHTPDALKNILTTMRAHTRGRLIIIVGSGGGRDRGKRPLMGKIAEKHADIIIVTDDNPRGEAPESIRAQIMTEATSALEIGDRADAIAVGISKIQRGDVLVVAGKGHETGQIVGNQIHSFNDLLVAQQAIRNAGGQPA